MTHNSSGNDDLIPNAAPTELQQLEAALQAKVISPELFATLVAQLRPNDALAVPAAPPASTNSPTENTELPSLLSLFESAPIAPVSLPVPPPLPAPVPLPVPASVPLPVPVPMAAPSVAMPQPRANNPMPTATWSALTAAAPAAAPPVTAPVAPPTVHVPAPEVGAEPASPPPRNPLTTFLAVLGGVGLLGVGLYLYVDRSHPSENLTGPQPTPTESAAPVLPSQPEAAVVAVPETVRIARPAVPATDSSTLAARAAEAAQAVTQATTLEPELEAPTDAPAPENNPAGSTATDIPTPVPAAPEPDDDDATRKIRTVLANYYTDLFAPPLAAENYFAPQVERLYIQRNLTPAQINTTITQTFFPDNKKAVYQVEPGTLRVSAPVQDGSRTATYSEACRLFRVSKGRYQRLRTLVRVKFDADYRITFLRQEKMLENVVE